MPQSLASVIGATRRRLFTGRSVEVEVFATALEGDELPFHILSVYGPGGVGKTHLIRAFQQQCDQHEVAAYYVDGRDIEPSASSFIAALQNPSGDGAHPLDFLQNTSQRAVLFVDTCEALTALDRWFREEFVPALSMTVVVVFSGRHPLPTAWRTDPGLSPILHLLPLRNLSTDESRQYLSRRDIPPERQGPLLSFAHGHPLALSLLADTYWQKPDADLAPTESIDTITPLLQRFIQEVPTEIQRMALEATSIVNYTTEALLAELLDLDDAHDLFTWMRGLSFIDTGMRGLFPHDITREVLVADLRWRNPDRYNTLIQRASRFYTGMLKNGHTEAHEYVLTDYVFAHRFNPIVRPFFAQLDAQWQGHAGYVREWARPHHLPELRDMVARHEGKFAAALFFFWAGRAEASLQLYRDATGRICGFLMILDLDEIELSIQDVDPAVRAALAYLRQNAPLRPGERATMFRFWMDGERHQAISPVQSLIFVDTVRHYLTTPRLAFTFLPCAESGYWQMALRFAGIDRIPDAGFRLEGRPFSVFGHDWRTMPPGAWLEQIAGRIAMAAPSKAGRPEPAPALLVLGEEEFALALKEALKCYPHPERLRNNPLLRSRLVLEAAGGDLAGRITALQGVLRDAAEKLNASPPGAKCYRALRLAYLEPSPSQERAAEQLDLPFSTFRRHLKNGLERLTVNLWQRELGA